jgi:Putative amidase domain
MAYKRENALSYANKYWNLVCHDGVVAVVTEKNGVDTTSLKSFPKGTDISKMDIEGENDCAHFVSCCIGTHGGGYPITKWEFGMAYGFLSAPNLANYLKTSGGVSLLGEFLERGAVDEKLAGMAVGDVIGYATGTSYKHMAIYTGKGNIACHTSSRMDKAWSVVSYSNITLFHFAG